MDYRKLYCATAAAGGVKIDLIHDVDYLISLFGMPERLVCCEGKYSDLAIDSSDCASLLARYEDKIVELHLDYFGRRPQRYAEMYTSNDTVRFDFISASVSWLKSGRQIDFCESRNDFQKREMEYFIDFSDNRISNINSIPFANNILSLLTKGDRYASI
jgi:predicted dehydrogenase